MTKTFTTRESPPDGMAPDQAIDPRTTPAVDAVTFAARLRVLIGQKSVSSFSRRCGIAESVLRTYLNDHRMPPLDKALAIAVAAGVTVDWLATGRSARVAAQVQAPYGTAADRAGTAAPSSPLDAAMLGSILKDVLETHGRHESPEHLAALATDLYRRATVSDPSA